MCEAEQECSVQKRRWEEIRDLEEQGKGKQGGLRGCNGCSMQMKSLCEREAIGRKEKWNNNPTIVLCEGVGRRDDILNVFPKLATLVVRPAVSWQEALFSSPAQVCSSPSRHQRGVEPQPPAQPPPFSPCLKTLLPDPCTEEGVRFVFRLAFRNSCGPA